MWQIFGSEIGRFAILVVTSLIVFGLFWLYFDAWLERRVSRTVPLLLGLITLSLSFLAQGMSLETQILSSAWQGTIAGVARDGYLYLRAFAYLLILIGLIMTPLEDRPKL